LSAVKRTMQAGEGLSIRDGIDLEIRHFMKHTQGEACATEMARASLQNLERSKQSVA
jgi:hypothetical protein